MMREVGLGDVGEVRISGGGVRSGLWRRILADVLGVELVAVQTTEGAAFGAALLAGVGAGVWETVEEACGQAVELGERTRPTEGAAAYEELYRRFREHYPALRPLFEP